MFDLVALRVFFSDESVVGQFLFLVFSTYSVVRTFISPIPLGLGGVRAFSLLRRRWFGGRLNVGGICLLARPMCGSGLWVLFARYFTYPIRTG